MVVLKDILAEGSPMLPKNKSNPKNLFNKPSKAIIVPVIRKTRSPFSIKEKSLPNLLVIRIEKNIKITV